MADPIWSRSYGINWETVPPRTTPIKLDITSAEAEPKKTAKGLLLEPLMVIVAI